MAYRDEIKKYKAAAFVAKRLISHEDVNDIYIGKKYVNGLITDDFSIRINVNKKKPQSKIKSNNLLPKKIGKFITDVTDFKIERNARQENPTTLIRPLLGGLQIQSSLFDSPADWGTIGCVLNINGTKFGITNFHVTFGENSEENPPPSNKKIIQPKQRNFGESIGRVTSVYSKLLDYSLFTITQPIDLTQSINGFDGEIDGYINPIEGLPLFKYGASTGKTFGFLDARSVMFPHRIIIRFNPNAPNDTNRISAPGDSGSAWVTRVSNGNLKVAALHFGGDSERNIAFANLFSSISPSIRNQIPSP